MQEDITTPAAEVASGPNRGPDGKFTSSADATGSAEAAAPGNCTGELLQLPDVPGTTFHSYECQTCHQIVNVGMEELEANGLPTEHAVLALEHA